MVFVAICDTGRDADATTVDATWAATCGVEDVDGAGEAVGAGGVGEAVGVAEVDEGETTFATVCCVEPSACVTACEAEAAVVETAVAGATSVSEVPSACASTGSDPIRASAPKEAATAVRRRVETFTVRSGPEVRH